MGRTGALKSTGCRYSWINWSARFEAFPLLICMRAHTYAVCSTDFQLRLEAGVNCLGFSEINIEEKT